MGGVGYRFYRGRFHEGDVFFGGCCPQECLLACLFSGLPPIYAAFSFYS